MTRKQTTTIDDVRSAREHWTKAKAAVINRCTDWLSGKAAPDDVLAATVVMKQADERYRAVLKNFSDSV